MEREMTKTAETFSDLIDRISAENGTKLDFGKDQAVKNLVNGKAAFWQKPVRGEYFCIGVCGDANIADELSEALSMWNWRRRGDTFAMGILSNLIPLNAKAQAQLNAAYEELSSFLEAAE